MNPTDHSQKFIRVQRATTAAFLFLAGAVLLAGAVTFWQCIHLPSLGLAWTLDDGHVTVVEPEGPAAGVVEPDDRLLALNGLRFVPGGDVMRIIREVRPGEPAQLLVDRAGQKLSLTIVPAAMDLTIEGHLIDYVAGVALWGLGGCVFLKRKTSVSARLFLLFNLTAALGLWGNVSLFVDPWYAALRRLALSLMTPYLFTNLIMSLPQDRWPRRPFLRARLVYYVLSLLLGLVGAITALFLVEWGYPLYLLILGNQIAGFVVAALFVIATYRLLPQGAERDRYRGAVTFFLLGALPFVSTITLGFWQSWYGFDPRLITIATFAMPLALAYVILRYQFLGVRVAVRQGLTIALTLASTIVILLIGYILANSLLSSVRVNNATELALFTAALTAAALFEPTRRYIQHRLQHVLDQREVELYEALDSFSRKMTALQNLPLLLDSLIHRLEALFPHTRIFVVVRDEANGWYQVTRSTDPASMDHDALTFPITGSLARQLRQSNAILPRQWATILEHLPLEDRCPAEYLQPEVLIPLMARPADLLGWIALGAQGGSSSYDEREVALLVSLANQASAAIANAQLYDQRAQMVETLQKANRQLAALQEIGISLTGHLPPQDVLQRVVQGLYDSGDYAAVMLGKANEARTAIEIVAYYRSTPQVQTEIENAAGRPVVGAVLVFRDEQHPAAQAIRHGRVWKFHSIQEGLEPALGLAHLTRDPARAAEVQQISADQTYVVLPLHAREDLVGVLIVSTRRLDIPDPEIQVLRTFAHQAAVAIENAQLWEETDQELRRRVQELSTLNAIAEAVNSTLDLDEVLNRALARTIAVTRFDMGAIVLLDEARRLQPANSYQVPSSILNFLKQRPPENVEQLLRNLPMVIDDVATDSLVQDRSLLLDAGLQAFCVVPLVSRQDPVGILGLGLFQGQSLTRADISLAEAVAQQLGIAIANARLYEEMSEEKQKTETILKSIGDGVCTTDRDLILLSWNPAAEQLLGWPESEVIGRHCRQVLQCHNVDKESLCEVACPLDTAMQNRQYEYSHLGASFMRTRDGRRIPTWNVAGPLADPAGTVLGGVLALRDASYEAEMERLQAEFISMISHEVRTPLTNLKAAAQTITRLGHEPEAEIQANLARIIAEQCDRLDSLVKRVEDTAQIEAGHLDLRITSLHLPSLVHRVVRSFRSREPHRTFEVSVTDEAPLWVVGDEDRISTILHTLLDNAAKYSRPQGSIDVNLSSWDQSLALVSVMDQGPLIPNDQRARIFQRFYRIDNSDARSVYGLGLGLYVARNLVTALGGQIWVEENSGLGNCFCFTLPHGNEKPITTKGE